MSATFGKIGARDLLEHRKFSDRYVQDGLVAMWDGQWNAGWGKHDPNATVWKDLSGNGLDMDMPTTGASVFENCIVFNGGRAVGQASELLASVYGGTVEIVAKRETAFSNATVRSFAGAGRTLFWRGIGTTQGGPIGAIAFYSPSVQVKYFTVQNIDTTRPFALSLRFYPTSASTVLAPANGVAATVSNVYNAGSTTPTSATPNAGASNLADGATTIYTMRAYTRVLTTDEMSANYAIDKARFNLS